MPAITQEHQDTTIQAGKKRRRDDDDANRPMYEGFLCRKTTVTRHLPPTDAYLYSPNLYAQDRHVNHASRRPIVSGPTSKRLRESLSEQAPAKCLFNTEGPKAQDLLSPPPELHEALPNTVRPTPLRQPSTLNRCHICHRKQTKKSDLESFADCEGCYQRTCYVCLRECLDWRTADQKAWDGYRLTMRDGAEDDAFIQVQEGKEHRQEGKGGGWKADGHRRKICSACCVERGQDGDAVCLKCLPSLEV